QRLGMPDCPATDAIAADPVWRIDEFNAAYRSCPALAAWGAAHQDSAMGEFARAAPWTYARMTIVLFGQTLIGQHYASTPAVLPGRVIRFAFPSDPVAPVAIPIALALAFGLALAAALWIPKPGVAMPSRTVGMPSRAIGEPSPAVGIPAAARRRETWWIA